MLEKFGVGPEAERVYSALMDVSEAGVAELVDATGLSVGYVRVAVEQLVASALAHPVGQCWRADPPEAALGPTLTDRQIRLDKDRAELERLTSMFRQGAARRDSAAGVRVLAGRSALAAALRRVQQSARKEIRGLVRPPVVALPPAENAELQFGRMAYGLTYRVIYDRKAASAVRVDGGEEDQYLISRSLEAGEQVRVRENVPVKLMLSDQGVAVVSVGHESWDGSGGPLDPPEPRALLVTEDSLLVVLEELFERLWAEAVLVPGPGAAADGGSAAIDPGDVAPPALRTGSPPDGPGAEDLRLLALVVAGLPDRAVAGHLGVGTRTVERRMRALLDHAGVHTRIQLAVHAVRAGWI